MKIVYLGPEGSYTHEAALKHFGHTYDYSYQCTVNAIFADVDNDIVDYGVVPIENSNQGVVHHTLDMFVDCPALEIFGEILLDIHHALLSNVEQIADIKKVYAHPQALAQCREWLEKNLPQAECVAAATNTAGAQMAAQSPNAAAIASAATAEHYGLQIKAHQIQDHADNTTRFIVIGKANNAPEWRNNTEESANGYNTSLLLSAANKPGALYRLIKPLADHGVSMTRIESRPSRQARWEYLFFIDLMGASTEPNIATALALLREEAAMYRLLGSYPLALQESVP